MHSSVDGGDRFRELVVRREHLEDLVGWFENVDDTFDVDVVGDLDARLGRYSGLQRDLETRSKREAALWELVELPCGHFDLYYGPRAAEAALVEAEFLVEALLGAASTTLSVEQGSCASMSQGV